MMGFGSGSQADYLVLAIPARAIAVIGKPLLDDLKKQLNDGWVTNFVILSTSKSDDKDTTTFIDKLKSLDNEWAANRIVHKLDDESVREFVVRVCIDYDVTHFVDTRKSCIKFVVTEPGLADVKVYQGKPGQWPATRKWMYRTTPHFYPLLGPGNKSFDVIRTGITMTEPQEVERI